MVKTEEVIIVAVIIAIWMSFIMLFIKKWGRIRTLEPRYFLRKELLEGGVVSSPDNLPVVSIAKDDSLHRTERTCSVVDSHGATVTMIERATSPSALSLSRECGRNSVVHLTRNSFRQQHQPPFPSSGRYQHWSILKHGVVNNASCTDLSSGITHFSVADVYRKSKVALNGSNNNINSNKRSSIRLQETCNSSAIVNSKSQAVNNSCLPTSSSLRNDHRSLLDDPFAAGNNKQADFTSCRSSSSPPKSPELESRYQTPSPSSSTARSSCPFNNSCFNRENNASGSFSLTSKKKNRGNNNNNNNASCLIQSTKNCFSNKNNSSMISSQSLSKLNDSPFCYTFGSKGCNDACRGTKARKVKDSTINFGKDERDCITKMPLQAYSGSQVQGNEMLSDERTPLILSRRDEDADSHSAVVVVQNNKHGQVSQEKVQRRRKSEGKQDEDGVDSSLFNPYACTSFSNNHINTFLYDHTQEVEGEEIAETVAAASDSRRRISDASEETDLLNKKNSLKDRNDGIIMKGSEFKNEKKTKKDHGREMANDVLRRKTHRKPFKSEANQEIELRVSSSKQRRKQHRRQEGDDSLETQSILKEDQRQQTMHADDFGVFKEKKMKDNPRGEDIQGDDSVFGGKRHSQEFDSLMTPGMLYELSSGNFRSHQDNRNASKENGRHDDEQEELHKEQRQTGIHTPSACHKLKQNADVLRRDNGFTERFLGDSEDNRQNHGHSFVIPHYSQDSHGCRVPSSSSITLAIPQFEEHESTVPKHRLHSSSSLPSSIMTETLYHLDGTSYSFGKPVSSMGDNDPSFSVTSPSSSSKDSSYS